MISKLMTSGLIAGALGLAACGTATTPPTDDGRALSGIAPAGTDRLLVIDADGKAFSAVPAADGNFRIDIASTRSVSLFVIGNGETRVLRVAPAPNAPPSLTSLPAWTGEVSTAQLSTADANADGVDEEVVAEDNPLEGDHASAEAIRGFFAKNAVPAAARILDQAVERIQSCVALGRRQGAPFTTWLAAAS